MANRVVMGPLPGGGFGLRISRPGNDVLSTGLNGNQIAFDSRWSATSRVFLNGNVTLTVTSPLAYHTVNFGTTFASKPPTIIMFRDTSGSAWRCVDATNNDSWLPTGGYFEQARVYTDKIEIARPTFGSSREFCYLVMRPL